LDDKGRKSGNNQSHNFKSISKFNNTIERNFGSAFLEQVKLIAS